MDDCDVRNVIVKAFDSQRTQRPCLLLVHTSTVAPGSCLEL